MRSPALCASLALAVAFGAGCQDYNFNPVGKCLIQPATERVTLSDISSADVLFVVDDSGSMAGEQDALAAAFASFVNNLDDYNDARVAADLEPFDFHLAVTSTATMWNPDDGLGATCRSDCAGHAGSLVCCTSSNAPLLFPNRCDPGTCADGYSCRTDCPGLLGENYCCNASDEVQQTAVASCTTAGAKCGNLSTHYEGCTDGNRGVAVNGTRYPQGDFVSFKPAAGPAHPRVLHFDKSLYEEGGTGVNRQGFTSAQLISFFQDNVKVGTCGSGQETALAAARLAVEKALAGQQKDTYTLGGTPGEAAAEWPHQGAKLVLVFVGDEDDCSSPIDAAHGIVWDSRPPGQDACATDSAQPEGSRRLTPFGEYVNYFTALGRPVGAAFVISMSQNACGRSGTGACSPGICCGAPGCNNTCSATCGAQAAGFRLFDTAQGLRGRGADVFTGSICDGSFDLVLGEIANVVRPPAGLALPSTPAESVVTLLRIADRSGQTRKICRGPAPTTLTADEATAAGWDWWFTATRDRGDPSTVSRYVYINQTPTGACQANPGETYSADYIGRLPAEGCTARVGCRNALGGQEDDWACVDAAGSGTGTCICCAAGSTDPCCTGVGTAEELAACRI